MTVEFTIPTTPIAKARPRVLKNGMTYTPKKTKVYEALVVDCYQKQSGHYFEKSPISCEIDFYFEVPKSYTKKRLKAIQAKIERYTKKPDLDNLSKSITDALNKIAYKDDSQIIELVARKHYTIGESRAEVKLTEFKLRS